MSQEHNGPASELAGYTTVGDWLDRYAGPFFPTRSSVDWFIKRNRRELVERGALIPREGRSGSLVSIERMPQALIEILKRRALDGGFLWAPLMTTRGGGFEKSNAIAGNLARSNAQICLPIKKLEIQTRSRCAEARDLREDEPDPVRFLATGAQFVVHLLEE